MSHWLIELWLSIVDLELLQTVSLRNHAKHQILGLLEAMLILLHAVTLRIEMGTRLQTVALWLEHQGLVQVGKLILHDTLLQLLRLVKHDSCIVGEAPWFLVGSIALS